MEKLLNTFSPISLEEMSAVKLMNRTDTKFVTTMPVLCQLLKMAGKDYYIQEIGGERNMSYDTTYFDTNEMAMFYEHQHGHTNRQKIRFRTYVNSHLQFMEIKTKNNHGRTKKKRIEVADMNLRDQAKRAFLSANLHYDIDSLRPTISNKFDRITLVNRAKTERLTIDTNLRFHNEVTGQERNMGQLVVIELKRDGLCYSPVLNMLRELRVKPHGFSKYCMGAAFTNEQLQVNRFKPKMNDINRMLEC